MKRFDTLISASCQYTQFRNSSFRKIIDISCYSDIVH